jgi:Protein of unknown function (DUF3102)
MDEIESPDAVSEEINRLHEENCIAARNTIERAIRIGELLTKQKDRLTHGDWYPWFDKNIKFSHTTDERYRKLYEQRNEIKSSNVQDLSGAYRLIRDANKSSKATKGVATGKEKQSSKIKIDPRNWAGIATDSPGVSPSESKPKNKPDLLREIKELIKTYRDESGLSVDEYYQSLEELADIVDDFMEEIDEEQGKVV